MKSLKANLQTVLLIVFEVAVGILLLVNPEEFTRTVIIIFGIVLLLLGITYLVRFLREKKNNINNSPSLIVAAVSLIFGTVCVLLSETIIDLLTAIAVIYGIILVISGIYKLQHYFQSKKSKLLVSKVSIISGLLAIILGFIIVVYPQDAAFSVWMLAGIMLLTEAVIDFISLIQTARNNKDSKSKDSINKDSKNKGSDNKAPNNKDSKNKDSK